MIDLDQYNLSEQEKRQIQRDIYNFVNYGFRRGYSAGIRDTKRGTEDEKVWGYIERDE